VTGVNTEFKKNMNVYDPPYGHWFQPASGSEEVAAASDGSTQADSLESNQDSGHFGNGRRDLAKPQARKGRRAQNT